MAETKGSLLLGAVIAVIAVASALVALVLVSGSSDDDVAEAGPPTTEPVLDSTAPHTQDTATQTSVGSGQALLATLVVEPEGVRDGYDRDLFPQWIDADSNGCDTRCEVLQRQRRTDLAGLPEGGWLSSYEGYSSDDPSEFDVDHVVALAEAWESGASSWTVDKRTAFANDLEHGQLVAVTAATNRSKSDRDPAEWQPPRRESWCEFATDWVRSKAYWGLTVDRAELSALTNMLRGCP